MKKIKVEIESAPEKFKEILTKSNGIGEVCRKYNWPDNGKSREIIKQFIEKFKLNVIYKHPRKYQIIEKQCKYCNNKFQTLHGHPKEKETCSRQCANKFFAHALNKTRKQNISIGIEKKRNKIAEIKIKKTCNVCLISFFSKKKNQLFCSNKCSANSRKYDTKYREKLRQIQLKRIAEGTHSGWKIRNQPSYAELFFMKVLTNNNISYKFEEPCGKYFIDFAIESKRIALEIDGKQHLLEDRKKSDQLKDEYLKSQGWNVYRIPWYSINTRVGKEFIEQEIQKFVEFFSQKDDVV